MSAQLNCSLPSLVPRVFVSYYTCWLSNEDAENESVPYPEVQEEAPDSNPDGRALEAEPDGLEVEDLRWVLVRVDLTNWEIRSRALIPFPFPFERLPSRLYISGIWRWTDSFIS